MAKSSLQEYPGVCLHANFSCIFQLFILCKNIRFKCFEVMQRYMKKCLKRNFLMEGGESLKGWAYRSVLFLDLILFYRGQAPGSSPQRRYGRFSSVLKLWADSCLEIFLGKGWYKLVTIILIFLKDWRRTKHAKRTFLTPWYAYVCVSEGKKCSFFREIWRAFFSCYLRFEIHLFAYYQRILLSLLC